eukprot:CAMPEP_0170447856 /NCGR_PEP_ID=MMETSP0117_2-20130122/50396_1 /TAXON_ID=400756 /ORGANISM="Durinskia baltica, Strain CSIRO CS-38" /LENGTH=51 /DNA_ID=CAMNT_0010708983 /DNA_START=434 /DNA_END=586 /DNA_ORIENTATION=-
MAAGTTTARKSPCSSTMTSATLTNVLAAKSATEGYCIALRMAAVAAARNTS